MNKPLNVLLNHSSRQWRIDHPSPRGPEHLMSVMCVRQNDDNVTVQFKATKIPAPREQLRPPARNRLRGMR